MLYQQKKKIKLLQIIKQNNWLTWEAKVQRPNHKCRTVTWTVTMRSIPESCKYISRKKFWNIHSSPLLLSESSLMDAPISSKFNCKRKNEALISCLETNEVSLNQEYKSNFWKYRVGNRWMVRTGSRWNYISWNLERKLERSLKETLWD